MPPRRRALVASLLLPSLLLVALASGCLLWYAADDPFSGDALSLDAGTGDAQLCVPTPSQKMCVGKCYEQTDPSVGCSGPCTACDSPPNAQSTCVVQGSVETCALGTCNAQYGDCDQDASNGCETQTVTHDHCGSCAHTCGTDPFCIPQEDGGDGYICSATCPQPPFLQCGAECIDPLKDSANCGVCGHDCTALNGDGTCDGGVCSLSCHDNYCLSPNKKKCIAPDYTASPNCGKCGVDCAQQPGTECCTKAGVSSCSVPLGGPDAAIGPPGSESCQP